MVTDFDKRFLWGFVFLIFVLDWKIIASAVVFYGIAYLAFKLMGEI